MGTLRRVKGFALIGLLAAAAFAAPSPRNRSAAPYPYHLAMTPPMGWNSYDAYWGDVNEQEVRANAKYMAEHLKQYGWKYIVVDYYWYFPHPVPGKSEQTFQVAMDRYGRLLPAVNRFPSAAGGKGFKPLADYVHSLGLKFGIHIMRGIPRAAVERNLPILGTDAHARDIVDSGNTCAWSTAMYGVDVSKPAGRAYYDSIAKLYASWDVDFIKTDDMSRGENPKGETYHGPEIEALRKAMNRTGRPMVLSLSPGATALAHAASVTRWSQMWRMSDDMWDSWKELKSQFNRARDWEQFAGPNHWPDADMLPLGRIRIRDYGHRLPDHTRLTRNEQITMMTLWSIARSPLMMGGDLPSLDPFTLSLLTNREILAVDQHSTGNHELLRPDTGREIVWEADVPGGKGKYVALFNLGIEPAKVAVGWKELGVSGKQRVRDLWRKKDVGTFAGKFSATIGAHGAGMFKLTPLR
jgi:alpha-galactosidase